jgi:predicted transcriptional regulator
MNARTIFPANYWQNVVKGLLASGYTQESLADEVGVSQTTIADLSTGRTQEPRANLGFSLRALADSLSEGGGL